MPLYSAWGIRVKAHLFFIVYVIAMLLWSIPQSGIGPGYMALGMLALFGTVLLHEYGHCFACRWVGGEADEVLMWPLGGLATVLPPEDWKSHLWTVLGGPAVNAVLWPVFAVLVLAMTGVTWSAVLFNPFAPGLGLGAAQTAATTPVWLVTGAWWLMYINLILLAFNMLVPMYPMDAGRTIQALLWRSMGQRRATEITVTIGLVAAGVMAVAGIVFSETLLLALAIFGGLTCWLERRRLRFEGGDDFGAVYAGGAASIDEDEPPGPSKRELREQERVAAEREEVDRILAKISQQGMASLTPKERKALEKASAKKG
ncbi:MAG: hypothetical protein EA378_04585 [Phycisphaerales bacterium]|nr:MAG: hypothetical protein EA378_04585 [Phycisphaerales bacterium]